jgi:UDP-N-acetylmuramate dehydrogenase
MEFEEKTPLGPMTSFRVGGLARLFCRPRSADDVARAARRAAGEGVALRILGGGTNVLVADEGVSDLVARLDPEALGTARTEDRMVRAGGAAATAGLVAMAANSGLSGLEPLAGLPGTVGGGLRMNAGAGGGAIGELVHSVTAVTPDGRTVRLERSEIEFGYRESSLAGLCVVEAELELASSDPKRVRSATRASMDERWSKQPRGVRSAGCVFKNPPGVPAGRLIDELGLKGESVGGASVSEVHANFIVARGGALAADVLGLIEMIRDRARRERGIELELEIEVWR